MPKVLQNAKLALSYNFGLFKNDHFTQVLMYNIFFPNDTLICLFWMSVISVVTPPTYMTDIKIKYMIFIGIVAFIECNISIFAVRGRSTITKAYQKKVMVQRSGIDTIKYHT